jgi:hypothetical protein
VARHLATLPSCAEHRDLFWYGRGPIFYRGRMDRSARHNDSVERPDADSSHTLVWTAPKGRP